MSRQNILTQLGVYGLFLAIALLITWPLAANLSTHLTGFAYGDGHEMARHIWWYNHALRTGQPVFYQPLLGYPDGMEGVLLWAHPLQFFPAWLFAYVMPLPAAANLAILLTLALNGWAMYWLAYDRLKQHAPALLAGVAFMAAPTFQGHLGGGHAGLMVAWPIPLYVWALFKLRENSHWRWLAITALFFVLSPGGHILQLIYVLLPITAVFVLWQLIQRDWRGMLRTVLASIIGSAALLIFVLPIAQATFNTPAYTDEGGFTRYSADLLSVVSPSFFHPLYSHLEYPRRVLGVNLEEGVSYIGLVAGVLLLLGLWRFRADRSVRWWLALALVAWVFSLGPLLKIFDQPARLASDEYETFIPLPWALFQNLPFFSLARTPGRFNFTLALAVAMLAGYGAAFVWQKIRRPRVGWGIITALSAALLFDYQVFWPLPTIPAAIPQAVYDLAQRSDVRAVFNIPWDNLVAAKDALYLQTAHHKPMIAGHVTRSTPVDPAKLRLLENTLNPALLDEAGADVIILHKMHLSQAASTSYYTRLGVPFYEDAELAFFDVDEPQNPVEFQVLDNYKPNLDQLEIYAYAPNNTWVDLTLEFNGTVDDRTVAIYLDRELIHRWQTEGIVHIPIPVVAHTYHTVSAIVEPLCPSDTNPLLQCQNVDMHTLGAEQVLSPTVEAIHFERGVTLRKAGLPTPTDTSVRLLWDFDAPLTENDVRFVHVIDADGNPIAQQDNTLGVQRAGDGWAEAVSLDLPDDLPPGAYRVYVGWYTLPDVTRFGVLSDVEGARDNWALLGTFEVE